MSKHTQTVLQYLQAKKAHDTLKTCEEQVIKLAIELFKIEMSYSELNKYLVMNNNRQKFIDAYVGFVLSFCLSKF